MLPLTGVGHGVGQKTIKEMRQNLRPTDQKLFPKQNENRQDRIEAESTQTSVVPPRVAVSPPKQHPEAAPPLPQQRAGTAPGGPPAGAPTSGRRASRDHGPPGAPPVCANSSTAPVSMLSTVCKLMKG